jgi:hypothetical protein
MAFASPIAGTNIGTNLRGRLRNTELPRSRALLPLFEAVMNSIHATDERGGERAARRIQVVIEREPQVALPLDKPKRAGPGLENIMGFTITDDGVGFTDANFSSFLMLDTDRKAALGCRGVGRLLWLKAFDRVEVTSVYVDIGGQPKRRSFKFSPDGVADVMDEAAPGTGQQTTVRLIDFGREYRDSAPKGLRAITAALLEHCLWYFLRPGSAPHIRVVDGADSILLSELYEEYVHSSSAESRVVVKGQSFDVSHVKMRGANTVHSLSWCANDRVVDEEKIAGKIAGLHGRLAADDGESFTYTCFVTSPFLDAKVRPERFGFNIPETVDGFFEETEIAMSDIRDAVLSEAAAYLGDFLTDARRAGRQRVEDYAMQKAPRYKPILAHVPDQDLYVDPQIPDKELEVFLHRHYVTVELQMIEEGQAILGGALTGNFADYRERVAAYLEKLSDFKKSDLANFVTHRAMVIEFLSQSLRKSDDGKYSRESAIHELLVPMRKTSDDFRFEDSNLWLIDERLAFHEFLASDRELSSFPVLDTDDDARPDVCVLNVANTPLLLGEGEDGPFASVTIIELKRPMRADIGRDNEDPIAQCLDYLDRVRRGKVRTKHGRPIPNADRIPGFCYVVCDVLDNMRDCARRHSLKLTADGLGYFGFHEGYEAYVEVITFDRLIASAKQRHRAFFDKIGLPSREL